MATKSPASMSSVTPRKTVKQAAAYLTRLGARVLGVTLNQVAQSGHGYDGYYSYYQYYGHASDHAENGVVRNGTPRLAAGDDDGSSGRQHV